MTLDDFFEKFEVFASAPNAVPKMRELILDLAVRGKLVDQRPTDGDGQLLLNQIRAKNSSSNSDAETNNSTSKLSHLPSSWACGTLGEVTEIVRGVSFPGSAKSQIRADGQVACLRTASVQAEIDWDDLIYIAPSYVSRSDQWVAANDIIISMANSYELVGKVAIVQRVPQRATFGAFLSAIRPILIDPLFLLCVLRSPRMQSAFRSSSNQTTNIANISLRRMRPLPFPLPPLGEQTRIVAKVEDLMKLCDNLEAQLRERDKQYATLARASVARFAHQPTRANLDFLFHKSYSIDAADLRKAILTLAVQGRLVPQDPRGPPATEFYLSIPEEKEGQISRRVFRTPETVLVPRSEELFPIPNGWTWVRLGDVGDWGSGSTPARGNHELYGGGITWLKSGELNDNRQLADSQETLTDLALRTGSFRRNQPGDVLIAMYGATIGKLAILAKPAVTNQAVCGCTPVPGVLNTFLFFYLLSQRDQFHAASEGGAQPNISKVKIVGFPFPLPPLEEQRRIVAKVDQLLCFVDQLGTQLTTSRSKSTALLNAFVSGFAVEA